MLKTEATVQANICFIISPAHSPVYGSSGYSFRLQSSEYHRVQMLTGVNRLLDFSENKK